MKPLAFRIKHFKSIVDSGICTLSGDNITVLAGQNEAGKSAVLMALRDFDIAAGLKPETQDFTPDNYFGEDVTVAVQFEIDESDVENLKTGLKEAVVPDGFASLLYAGQQIWVERNLSSNTFSPEEKFLTAWTHVSAWDKRDDIASEGVLSPSLTDYMEFMRQQWPAFLYFEQFDQYLPRQIALLRSGLKSS